MNYYNKFKKILIN